MFTGKQGFVPFKDKIWLFTPTMHGEELKYITQAYETNWMSTVGENINEAERMICQKVGCKYAVALSCGTSALHLGQMLSSDTMLQSEIVVNSSITVPF